MLQNKELSMQRITLRAYGKLNLSLDIVGVREDGTT